MLTAQEDDGTGPQKSFFMLKEVEIQISDRHVGVEKLQCIHRPLFCAKQNISFAFNHYRNPLRSTHEDNIIQRHLRHNNWF